MDMLEQQMELISFVNYVEQLIKLILMLLPILQNVNQQLKLKVVMKDLY